MSRTHKHEAAELRDGLAGPLTSRLAAKLPVRLAQPVADVLRSLREGSAEKRSMLDDTAAIDR